MTKAEARPRVLVIGSTNMDLVVTTSRLPLPGESLFGEDYTYSHGGKGANQAVALARLGADVTLLGRVGNDQHGAELRHELAQEGIDISHVAVDRLSSSGFAVVVVTADAQNSILVFPGANSAVTREDVSVAFEKELYNAVLLQLELPIDIVLYACRRARTAGIPVILDAGPAQPFPLEEELGIEVLTPNQTEAYALTGIEIHDLAGARQAAKRLIDRSGAKAVVIKLGSDGALLQLPYGVSEYFPAHPISAVDPTSAGDAFTAALTMRYLISGDIRQAVCYANLAGALATRTLGARASLPTSNDIDTFARDSGTTRASYV